MDVMPTMPDECIDLVVTSPPYNLRNSSRHGGGDHKRGFSAFWNQSTLLKDGYKDHGDDMPHEQYVEWQRACLGEMMRLLKPTGAIFYNHTWRVQHGLMQDRGDIVQDFPVRQIIIWHRTGGINFNPGYFLPNYEVLYLICKPDFFLADGANRLGCVWQISQTYRQKHPASMPLALARRCIASTDAEVVLDPFVGLGTTAVAAQALGRRYVGIELSSEYCEEAREEIALRGRGLKTNDGKQRGLFDGTL